MTQHFQPNNPSLRTSFDKRSRWLERRVGTYQLEANPPILKYRRGTVLFWCYLRSMYVRIKKIIPKFELALPRDLQEYKQATKDLRIEESVPLIVEEKNAATLNAPAPLQPTVLTPSILEMDPILAPSVPLVSSPLSSLSLPTPIAEAAPLTSSLPMENTPTILPSLATTASPVVENAPVIAANAPVENPEAAPAMQPLISPLSDSIAPIASGGGFEKVASPIVETIRAPLDGLALPIPAETAISITPSSENGPSVSQVAPLKKSDTTDPSLIVRTSGLTTPIQSLEETSGLEIFVISSGGPIGAIEGSSKTAANARVERISPFSSSMNVVNQIERIDVASVSLVQNTQPLPIATPYEDAEAIAISFVNVQGGAPMGAPTAAGGAPQASPQPFNPFSETTSPQQEKLSENPIRDGASAPKNLNQNALFSNQTFSSEFIETTAMEPQTATKAVINLSVEAETIIQTTVVSNNREQLSQLTDHPREPLFTSQKIEPLSRPSLPEQKATPVHTGKPIARPSGPISVSAPFRMFVSANGAPEVHAPQFAPAPLRAVPPTPQFIPIIPIANSVTSPVVTPPVTPITPPVTPVKPVDPPVTKPVEPVDPPVTKPVKPVDPPVTKPVEPVDPPVTKPVEPVDPPVTKPVEPVDPPVTKPVKPVDPPVTKPVEPVDPPVTKPVEPVDPPVTKPVEPVDPPVTKPEKPVDQPVTKPEKPVDQPVTEPEKPVDPPVIKPVKPVDPPEKPSNAFNVESVNSVIQIDNSANRLLFQVTWEDAQGVQHTSWIGEDDITTKDYADLLKLADEYIEGAISPATMSDAMNHGYWDYGSNPSNTNPIWTT